jgi:N-acyl-L-homoserine lactone synthetase
MVVANEGYPNRNDLERLLADVQAVVGETEKSMLKYAEETTCRLKIIGSPHDEGLKAEVALLLQKHRAATAASDILDD